MPNIANNLPNYGGEKARRLYWATRKNGIVKVSYDGSLLWIWERKPEIPVSNGHIFEAKEFLNKAAKILEIQPEQVFTKEDDVLRRVARLVAGIPPFNPVSECGAEYANH